MIHLVVNIMLIVTDYFSSHFFVPRQHSNTVHLLACSYYPKKCLMSVKFLFSFATIAMDCALWTILLSAKVLVFFVQF